MIQDRQYSLPRISFTTILITLSVIICFSSEVFAQPDSLWSNFYGGSGRDNCADLIYTRDGGYALIGTFDRWHDNRSWHFYLVKTDSIGQEEWSYTYGGEQTERAFGGIQTSDGGYCLVGSSRFGMTDSTYAIIVRIDLDGEPIWQLVYSEFRRGDHLTEVVETSDGGFASAGNGRGEGNTDYYLLRTDSEGEPLWRTYFGDGGQCYSLILMEDRGYLLGGLSNRDGAWLVRTEPDPVNNDAVEFIDPAWPSKFSLGSPFPNPFNSFTVLSYSLNQASEVTIKIFDLTGREGTTLFNGSQSTGYYSVTWNSNNTPTGVYVCRLITSAGQTDDRKLVLIR